MKCASILYGESKTSNAVVFFYGKTVHINYRYYPKIDLTYCVSTLSLDDILGQFGIEEITGDFNPTVTKPDHLANMTYLEVVSNVVDWNPEMREEWQQKMLTLSHENWCGGLSFQSNYPNIDDEYVPPNQCQNLKNA